MRKKRHHGIEILNLDCESQLHQEALPACKNFVLDQRTKRYMRGLGSKAQEKLCVPLCLTLCSPMDCSLQGFSVRGISQVRILSGLLFPAPRDLLNPRTEPTSLESPALAGEFFTTSTIWEAHKSPDFLLFNEKEDIFEIHLFSWFEEN